MNPVENHVPSMTLRSSAASLRFPLPATPVVTKAEALWGKTKKISDDRMLLELDAISNDEAGNPGDQYDLYQSPCRGFLRASNDELLDHQDLDAMNDDAERGYIVSYNSNPNKESDLYKAYYYYFEDMEYCGSTFYGGCRFRDLEALEDEIRESEKVTTLSGVLSYVDWTVEYDYELHYTDRRQASLDDAVSSTRGDPIPALEQLEARVLEHLGEVVSLTRRGCDGSGRRRSTTAGLEYHHDFTDQELERILAISSEPKDILDPKHADCAVPVAATIAQNADCTPVTGGIRIYLNTTGILDANSNDESSSMADLKLSIQSGFQRLIRFGMQENLYVSEEDSEEEEVRVEYLSFIGTRVVLGDDGKIPDEVMDSTGAQVKEKDEPSISDTPDDGNGREDSIFASSNIQHQSNDNAGSLPSELIDSGTENETGKGAVVGRVVGSIGIIVVALLVVTIANLEKRGDNSVDEHSQVVPVTTNKAEETLDDVGEQHSCANNPVDEESDDALKPLGSGQSILSETAIEDDVYEDVTEDP